MNKYEIYLLIHFVLELCLNRDPSCATVYYIAGTITTLTSATTGFINTLKKKYNDGHSNK